MSTSGRQLLVAVVKGHRRVERVMEGFLELGVPGATVLDAKGMGQIVSSELPIFSGFRSLFPGSGEESYMILSVLTAEQVKASMTNPAAAKTLSKLQREADHCRRLIPTPVRKDFLLQDWLIQWSRL